MRIEICVALLASTALHAGLVLLAPASFAARDSAWPESAAPSVITAVLMDTPALGEAELPEPLISAPAEIAPPAQPEATVKRAPPVDNRLRFYPPEAVAKGIEGEAILRLHFGADGALIDAQIAKSSGYAILDEAALRAIRATPRFAAGPREMLFPVTFALR